MRIVAATNTNLEKLVKAGKFRKDLFYRINVIRVKLPPLRDRKEDIPLLVNHFMNRFSNLKGKLITDISPDALAILMNHDYPGNIRELENTIEHAFVLCRGSIIDIKDLPDNLRPSDTEAVPLPKSFDSIEANFILGALRKNRWNRAKTAAELGIHKTTLWRKMKKFGIRVSKSQ